MLLSLGSGEDPMFISFLRVRDTQVDPKVQPVLPLAVLLAEPFYLSHLEFCFLLPKVRNPSFFSCCYLPSNVSRNSSRVLFSSVNIFFKWIFFSLPLNFELRGHNLLETTDRKINLVSHFLRNGTFAFPYIEVGIWMSFEALGVSIHYNVQNIEKLQDYFS